MANKNMTGATFALAPSEPWWLIRWQYPTEVWQKLVEEDRHQVADEVENLCQVHAVLGFVWPGEGAEMLPAVAVAGNAVAHIIDDSASARFRSELFCGDEQAAFEARNTVTKELIAAALAAVEKSKAEAPRGFHTTGPAAEQRRHKKQEG